MTQRRRRRFSRPIGTRNYRKRVVLAVEGSKTEREYFCLFDRRVALSIRILPGKKKSAPAQVLKRMTDYLRTERLRRDDQAWLVVDRDRWAEDDLAALHRWSTTDDRFGLALSNPCFELWLLLHFTDAKGIRNAIDAREKLRRHVPRYDKGIAAGKLEPHIETAIERARQLDTPPCADWPRTTGTTVYRLVETLQATDTG